MTYVTPSIRISRVPTYSSYASTSNISSTGLSPSSANFSKSFNYILRFSHTGSFPFARRYLGYLIWFLFLSVLRCFSSQGSLHTPMYSVCNTSFDTSGFPHSDILGSSLVASSPGLFAGCHVFLRLLLPRHSPCALTSLDHITPSPLHLSQVINSSPLFQVLDSIPPD